MSNPIRAVTAGIAVVALSSGIALAQSASVTLNGQPVSLNPAPVERAGRVFVPLRGVFERLGASVVYQGGQINAQSANHSVALRIGSTQATVDGNAQNLDVAPFIVGASTYVPLRFVSQALGATVNYDGANHIVALSTNGAPVANNPPPQNRPPESAMRLRSVTPARGASVESRRPTIEAQFAAPVDPNTVRVSLDGLNITDQSSRSPNGVVFSPPSDLQSGRHTVAVTGTDANGQPFDQRWSFSSGTSTVTNTIQDLRPGEGASVGRQFTVSGHTLPGARVIVQAGTVNQPTSRDVIGQILGISGGNGGQSTVRSEVIADGNGAFNAPVSLNAQPGSQVTLVVDSTDARTQTAAPRVIRNLTIQ